MKPYFGDSNFLKQWRHMKIKNYLETLNVLIFRAPNQFQIYYVYFLKSLKYLK